jgi:hypothetical protein
LNYQEDAKRRKYQNITWQDETEIKIKIQ